MSIFKKPEKGFLAKLFQHKQVEELAEELAHTYADEMQESIQPECDEPTTAGHRRQHRTERSPQAPNHIPSERYGA